MKRLTKQTKKIVMGSARLQADIADHLVITTLYLRRLLGANTDERLTDPGVVELIKNHLADMQDMQIIEDAKSESNQHA